MSRTAVPARAVACAALVLSLALAGSTRAARGGPDAFGNEWRDNFGGCPGGTGSFGAGAMTFPGETGLVGPFDLGFVMPYFGEPVDQVWVSPHGWVTFSPGQPNVAVPQLMPDPTPPNHLVAVHWLDATMADITVESSPTRFHVRWSQFIGAIPLQLNLFLERDGLIRMTWNHNFFTEVTVGYEDRTGGRGVTLFRREGSSVTARDGSFPEPLANRSACIEPPALLDCSSAIDVSCGESAAATLPGSAPRNAFLYTCSDTLYEGNEQVFRLDLTSPQAVGVSATGPADLDLLRVDPCAENACLALAPTGSDAFDFPVLFPGTYWFVTDKVSAGGGDPVNFQVDCVDPFTDVACGDTVSGDTTGGSSFRAGYSCAGPSLSGPEALYRLTLDSATSLAVTLDTAEPDLWVAIFDAATFEASSGATCLSAGRGGAGVPDAPPGDYVILVDGAGGAAAPFDLRVACGTQLDCSAATTVSCTEIFSGDTTGSPSSTAVYGCLSEVLTGAEDVHRFFNPIEQSITAELVSSQPGQRLLLLPECDEGSCLLSGDEGVSCALFPPGEYLLVVDGTAGSEGPYEVQVTCSEFLVGVDLRVSDVDASALTGDCRSFDVSGSAAVAVTNLGTSSASAPFDVVVFEDGGTPDGAYDPAVDNVLGIETVTSDLGPGETVFVDVASAGTVLFRDNVIHAVVDPDDVVVEVDETNNSFDTGRGCEFRPPVGPFSPEVEWTWDSSTVMPDFTEVDTVPLVGDVDGDGMPDVVFNTAPRAGGNRAPAVVRAVRGDGSRELWTATAAEARVWGRSQLALGDIDGDGRPEVIGQSGVDTKRLVAIDDDGSYLWQSEQFNGSMSSLFDPIDFGGGAPALADLDCDGSPEIVFGNNVFNADGTHAWTPAPGGRMGRNVGTFGPDCPISVVADVDLDGELEVVAGPTAYAWNRATGTGEILWDNAAVPDGHAAVGNFDEDDFPEIAITANGTVYLLEGDTGALIWQRAIPGSGSISGGPPTVADFDGDCAAEVGVAGSSNYVVLETDGTVKWQSPINDTSSHRTASSVFDFEGDGAAEVAFQDQHLLRVFRGTDGTEIATVPASSHTWIEMIAIADVDADNNAEIIQPLNRGGGSPTPMGGIAVVGDADDNWVNTRRTWNQHAYHIDNVNEDGTIPGPSTGGCERASWLRHNTYRDQIGTAIFSAADITISILETEILLTADCFRDLRIVARVGNGGAIAVGRDFEASFWDGDPAAGGTLLSTATIPDLDPGEFGDFEIVVPFPRFGTIDVFAVADDDGSGVGAGAVNECREDNNVCVVTVDNSEGGSVGDPPPPVGSSLRATAHGDPDAPVATATFDWSRDPALPRADGEHYHLLRGILPTSLVQVAGTHPYEDTTWNEATPAAAVLPFVHFYKIVAADRCEQEEDSSSPP